MSLYQILWAISGIPHSHHPLSALLVKALTFYKFCHIQLASKPLLLSLVTIFRFYRFPHKYLANCPTFRIFYICPRISYYPIIFSNPRRSGSSDLVVTITNMPSLICHLTVTEYYFCTNQAVKTWCRQVIHCFLASLDIKPRCNFSRNYFLIKMQQVTYSKHRLKV